MRAMLQNTDEPGTLHGGFLGSMFIWEEIIVPRRSLTSGGETELRNSAARGSAFDVGHEVPQP